ncbi:glycoside hydrolase superfamily [Cyathus striatus]|nr:glycoside hydrolase superfamily [Cyathus striatus]
MVPPGSSPYSHQPLANQSTPAFQNMSGGGYTPWEAQPKSSKKKWWIIGGIAALIAIIIAVVVGVVVSKNNNKNRTTSNSGDPSNFSKDSRLKKSFYGLAYTPEGSQLPDCGNKLEDLMSQLTTRIRLYGADCNQSALVVHESEHDCLAGNYPIATDNNAAYDRQRDTIKDAISTYGTDNIGGITVGNEFMLNYLTANGVGSEGINGDVANQGAALIIADIQDTRNMLSGLSLDKTIPVGNADAGSFFNNMVLAAVDYGMANVHPWFANVSAQDSAGWTANFFEEFDVTPAKALSNSPQMYIAETGWPTQSSDEGNASNGPSTASEANLQEFLNTFICQANANNTEYFFFEYFDEPWKDQQFGGVEGWWGLFNSNRTLKNIEIPDCPSP